MANPKLKNTYQLSTEVFKSTIQNQFYWKVSGKMG